MSLAVKCIILKQVEQLFVENKLGVDLNVYKYFLAGKNYLHCVFSR